VNRINLKRNMTASSSAMFTSASSRNFETTVMLACATPQSGVGPEDLRELVTKASAEYFDYPCCRVTRM